MRTGCMSVASHEEGRGKERGQLCPGQAPPTGLTQHCQGVEPSPKPAWEAVCGQSRDKAFTEESILIKPKRVSRRWPG